MNTEKKNELHLKTLKSRERILKMSTFGGVFVGSAYSCIDIITYLYQEFLNISFENLLKEDRDYFFLSKGHAVSALYATFVQKGWLEEERLYNNGSLNDDIYLHPNINIPGIEFNSGSLGHMLSVAIGTAIDLKNNNNNQKVIVLLGDGELNEGSNWESLLIATACKLDNLVVIIDRNKFQANYNTEKLIPLDSLEDKFKSFNCGTKIINGHNFFEIDTALNSIPFKKKYPSIIIAETVRGKGIPSIENDFEKWFMELSNEESEVLIDELYENYK